MKRSFGNAWLNTRLWLGPLLFMAIVAVYFLIRFDGYWAEADSSAFTRYIRDFVREGKLVPETHSVYPNGYAYQAISTFIVALTGLEVETLQQLIYPLIATIVVVPAWTSYRQLTGSNLGATLATLLIFTQPEFLFAIIRSSHEKFTRILILLCLFLLSRSISQRYPPYMRIIYVGLLFFTTYALITSNLLFANSFILALIIVYVLGWILERYRPNLKAWNRDLKNRLRYVIPICIALVYVFVEYIYPPAYHDFLVLQNTWDLIRALFAEKQNQLVDIYVAYKYINFGWINLPVYLLLSIANWIVLLISFMIWLRQGWNWIIRSEVPKNQTVWLLWLFYAAFIIEEGLAVVSDASGALSSNLQLRLFPSFSMVAVAIIGKAWAEWQPQKSKRRIISLGLAGVLFSIAILSVMKATNEPLFSNKWNFYSSNEIIALQWGDSHTRNAALWADFDERLAAAYITEIGDLNNNLTTIATPNARNMLLSTIIRLRSIRLGQPLPVPPDALQVYDNGSAQLFHLRPETPYQH